MYNYDYTYDTSYTDGALAGFTGIYVILSLAIVVFAIITMWKIFEKAGKEGWRAIVPLYNAYTLFEITWGNGWYFLLLFLAIIPILGYIAVLVIIVMTYVKLAKAFGKSGGFAVGLIFLSFVFMAILAFDSSTYIGVPQKESTNTNPNPIPPQATTNVNNVGIQPVTNFNNNVAQPTQTTSYCSNCGTALPAGTAFCPNCGTKKTN